MKIIGAGLSGLISAHAFPRAEILEAAKAPTPSHAALLRFRSDKVAHLTGIEFKPVEVRKAIWMDGVFVEPNPKIANMYSKKVIGEIGDRSIWNLAPVTRYIAPETFYEQLVVAHSNRLNWGIKIDGFPDQASEAIISTVPLHYALQYAKIETPTNLEFNRRGILVQRYRIPRCNAYQTIYFPSPDTAVYRASITGSLLIVEMVEGHPFSARTIYPVLAAFDIMNVDNLGTIEQRYGKIAPIDDVYRKQMLYKLTQEHGVFSVGRFAIWKNILLDDVVDDLMVVRKLMHASGYDQSRTLNAR